MNLRDVLHKLVDCSSMRWEDEDGKRSSDAHEAIDRFFIHPSPDGFPWIAPPPEPPADPPVTRARKKAT
jgi:hypothetical protein